MPLWRIIHHLAWTATPDAACLGDGLAHLIQSEPLRLWRHHAMHGHRHSFGAWATPAIPGKRAKPRAPTRTPAKHRMHLNP